MAKPSDIKLNSSNPRIIKDDKYKKLVKSLKEFPQMADVRPVVIDETNTILGGNMRYKAMIEAGWDDIPVKQVKGWTEEQKKEFIVKDNLGYGEWDYDILANDYDLSQLEDYGMDLPDDLKPQEEVKEDEAPEVDETSEPISKLGEVYQLGRHRLMCGDSTKIEDVEKLMDGNKADMVFTDPPYGIAHSGKGITGSVDGNDFGEIIGDGDIEVAVDAYNLCKTLGIESQVWWGANYYCSHLDNGHGWIVWDKEKEGDVFSGFEMAYSTKGIKSKIYRHKWHGMIRASEQGQKTLHPTQKPVKLCADILDDFNEKIILDLFGGSGSTLIACEQTDRTCYMMELDEKYCDVIRKRYNKFVTGNEKGWEESTQKI